jgi:hypothetical protein
VASARPLLEAVRSYSAPVLYIDRGRPHNQWPKSRSESELNDNSDQDQKKKFIPGHSTWFEQRAPGSIHSIPMATDLSLISKDLSKYFLEGGRGYAIFIPTFLCTKHRPLSIYPGKRMGDDLP